MSRLDSFRLGTGRASSFFVRSSCSGSVPSLDDGESGARARLACRILGRERPRPYRVQVVVAEPP
jgi:hypothetical protein